MDAFIADEAKLAKQLFSGKHFLTADNLQLEAMYQAIHDDQDWFIELLQQYRLTSKEGLLLMCLAEALLRIPDQASVQALFNDKIHRGDWQHHSSDKHWNQIFAHSLHWLAEHSENHHHKQNLMERLSQKGAIEICSAFINQMSSRFVFAEQLDAGLIRSRQLGKHESCSFDMLGEAALTYDEAEAYFTSYLNAIEETGLYNQCVNDIPHQISIKLSALHPRYEASKEKLIKQELLPKIITLCKTAANSNVQITLDAEEQHRLELSLKIFEQLIKEADIKTAGLAIQAYGKRALQTIDRVYKLAVNYNKTISIRLVKGAYWDYEIKRAQQLGLSDYPVWSEKQLTDANYLLCAEKLMQLQQTKPELIQSEFATHNPETLLQLQAIHSQLKIPTPLKLQRLHGMGEIQHQQMADHFDTHSRVYCPVGEKSHLLPYLVRRLIENGANSSFIYQAHQQSHLSFIDIQKEVMSRLHHREYRIPRPAHILSYKNSSSLDISNDEHFQQVDIQAKQTANEKDLCDIQDLNTAIANIHLQAPDLKITQGKALLLECWADELANAQHILIPLLVQEAGKTYQDALDEIREACDFCRYYAQQVRAELLQEKTFLSVTGERNEFIYRGKGMALCISPWNFPLAILVGQIAAAWVSGNKVIAKPASQTPDVARAAIQLAYKAGINQPDIQLILHTGKTLLADLATIPAAVPDLVCFTGSSASAKTIQQQLAAMSERIIPFVAETGGQNVLIADSSALIDQLVPDVIQSAFYSAGQRCSALRVAYIQEDIWNEFCTSLKGAMATLKTGDPFERDTDIGPVIDAGAYDKLESHRHWLEDCATLIARAPAAECVDKKHYFSPVAYQIFNLNQLQQEHFGPILHLIRYRPEQLDTILNDITASGYGLTMGLHSRNQDWLDNIINKANIGNIYVNRTMTGAKVGSQPFGGHGLSGTGPKAGGPNYLKAMVNEHLISTNTTAWGGNTDLL